jgi:hypothetical protein
MELSKIVFCIEMGQPILLDSWNILSALTTLRYLSSSKPLAGTIEGVFYEQTIIFNVEKDFSIKAHAEKHRLAPPQLMVTCFNKDGTKTLLVRRPVAEILAGPSMYYRYTFDLNDELLDFPN